VSPLPGRKEVERALASAIAALGCKPTVTWVPLKWLARRFGVNPRQVHRLVQSIPSYVRYDGTVYRVFLLARRRVGPRQVHLRVYLVREDVVGRFEAPYPLYERGRSFRRVDVSFTRLYALYTNDNGVYVLRYGRRRRGYRYYYVNLNELDPAVRERVELAIARFLNTPRSERHNGHWDGLLYFFSKYGREISKEEFRSLYVM